MDWYIVDCWDSELLIPAPYTHNTQNFTFTKQIIHLNWSQLALKLQFIATIIQTTPSNYQNLLNIYRKMINLPLYFHFRYVSQCSTWKWALFTWSKIQTGSPLLPDHKIIAKNSLKMVKVSIWSRENHANLSGSGQNCLKWTQQLRFGSYGRQRIVSQSEPSTGSRDMTGPIRVKDAVTW